MMETGTRTKGRISCKIIIRRKERKICVIKNLLFILFILLSRNHHEGRRGGAI